MMRERCHPLNPLTVKLLDLCIIASAHDIDQNYFSCIQIWHQRPDRPRQYKMDFNSVCTVLKNLGPLSTLWKHQFS